MRLSKIKSRIVAVYNYTIGLLPFKLANRLIWVDRQMDWSISIYEGRDFLSLKPTTVVANPVISRSDVTDTLASFVADPFMVRVGDEWLMFFEVFNHKQHKGELAFARSQDGYKWNYQKIILTEDFHLSYPYVFEFESDWYLIPESCEANSVRLYKANKFPDEWEFVTEILVGQRFVDASILHFNGLWWLFVGVEPTDRDACNSLKLYYADRLVGNWIEHPMSPIVSNNSQISRPAGRMRQIDNRPIRFTQDCQVTYGYNVTAIAIELLTTDEYREARIHADGTYLFELGTMSSNRVGMHHLDFIMSNDDRCIACVDAR
ncbi:hypothetical protein [Chamaesiphon sp. VAR_48_metabat_403]|uniref:glucosamine inositolphosphorylceramide transferase family protein n=1 Tax=Chamaesiphon sp. VAR_48_metabat_403 TaxID=2964700 RepID=UPI00286E507A|nr:hypothetical protein [Chamaesiphon sp. VAR_48_metabat_403]